MSTLQSSSSVKLGRKEKVGYALGDLASNFSYGFVSLFLLYFYTDIYGLTAAQASLIFLIARTIDAIYNLLIGYVIDKTKTKHGKLRPYLLHGAVPLGALTVACFTAVESDFKFWFALCSYTIYCLAYTTVNTPYSAMTNMLTQDSDSRIGLSIYRFIAAMLGFFIVSVSAEALVGSFSEPSEGYMYTAGTFATIATLLFLICFASTKERVATADSAISLKEMVTTVKSNGPLHALSIYTGFIYIAFTLWMAVAVFYVMYVIGDPEFIPTFFIIQTIANIFSLALANKLMLSLGKKKTALYSLPVGIAIAIFQYFVPADNVTLLMSCIFIFTAVLGINMGVMWTMAADTVEYSEWKTGLRAEGAVYGYYNFTTKIAMAIGGGLSGFILGAYGYDAELGNTAGIRGDCYFA
ncbi:sugar:cation symporter family protein [Vibrio mediterranei AK1]|uniref:MFS transporter n=1 Tax=Vibrio mediterranei TaxID=689 RepID=UPI0001540E38|nr:glycoside-pentoside-hexuronide (GPH):cation symporter [Vibrio mediterranei]EDL55297.1 sugar:cation symporter family protein [Vibrio mediterranei AK1]